MLKEVPDKDMDLWRPVSNLRRSTPMSTFRRGSEVKGTPTAFTQEPSVIESHITTTARTLELPKPAAPVSVRVADYDHPRPWRYVRWRKANDRQALPPSERKAVEPKGNCVYKVLPGEKLADVAEKFDTYVEVLAEANGILNPRNVAIGQLLWVPKTHLIKRGNTLWSLSRRFGVPITTIQRANGIENPNLIFAGDILVIPEELD